VAFIILIAFENRENYEWRKICDEKKLKKIT